MAFIDQYQERLNMTPEEYIAAECAKTYVEALAFAAAEKEGADVYTICGDLLRENARLQATIQMAIERPDLFKAYYELPTIEDQAKQAA